MKLLSYVVILLASWLVCATFADAKCHGGRGILRGRGACGVSHERVRIVHRERGRFLRGRGDCGAGACAAPAQKDTTPKKK